MRRPCSATTSAPERELRHGLGDGSLAEIEVAWSDPFGHAQGKRIPASQFLNRAVGSRIRVLRSVSGLEHRRHRDRLAAADQLGRRVPRRVRRSGSVHLSAVAVASASRSCHLRHRCARPQPVTTGSTRGAPEGDRAAGLTRLHRENRRGVRALSAQPRRITVSGRHPRLLAGERQRARSTAQRPVRDVGRLHASGGHSNRVRPRSDRDEPGLHRRAGSRRRCRPAQVRHQGGGPKARQDRQFHAEAVHRTLRQLPAPAHLTLAWRRAGLRSG